MSDKVWVHDRGAWRRYINARTLAAISVNKASRRVWVIAGWAPALSFEITRKEAAGQLRAARRSS